MMSGDSKVIVTNQSCIHKKLNEVVNKHLSYQFQKPFQQHTKQAFAEIDVIVQQFDGEIILDACCDFGSTKP